MSTYSDPALILPGAVGQTELDAASKKGVANGVAGLDASVEIPDALIQSVVCRSVSLPFTGNDTVNRAIPHGLGRVPKFGHIRISGSANDWRLAGVDLAHLYNDAHYVVTAMDATNIYVGNAASYPNSANGTGTSYIAEVFA